MSRDDVEEEYLALAVPASVSAAWLQELTEKHLSKLSADGNWWSVYVFGHHADYRHVAAVLGSEPRGQHWERCAFLETMLRYVNEAASQGLATADQVEDARRLATRESDQLYRRARSDASRSRVDEIRRSATLM
jgi:hypothetical protein